ncbi:MAG: DUF1992 domain-containing protein [Verrucomicrobia bacterium]|nr:DUF1992 domain-containing protein [Verrucomicrobiota bacterium]
MGLGIEKIIQEWLATTSSEDLPGKGKPLNLDEYFRWPEELRFAYSIMKNAGYVPEEVELLREIGSLKEKIDHCADSAQKRFLCQQLEHCQVSLNLRLEQRRRR